MRVTVLVLAAAACHYDLDAVDRPSGDGGPADVADAPISDQPNVVFLTSVERAPPLFGGIDGADDLCQDLAAAAADLPDGTYRAWLSSASDGIDARDRLGGARGWVRPDGKPFADTVGDLVAGRIFYPAALDQNGDDQSGGPVGALVATGTAADGTATGEDCGGFTSNQGSLRLGRGDAGVDLWTAADLLNCTTDMRVYCFGVDRAHVLEPPAPGERLAFVTRAAFEVAGGLDGADDACAADAEAAGLGDRSFKALLATSSASALSRFELSPDRPWIRVDGVRVTDDFAALTAPLEVTASGEEHVSSPVFTGAAGPDELGSATCADWETGTGADSAQMGVSARSSTEAFGGLGILPCDTPAHLYCLEP